MTLFEIEEAVARYYDYRSHIIVPNVSWGWDIHECDLIVVRPSGYAIEIEIKRSRADIKADGDKRHGHVDRQNRIKQHRSYIRLVCLVKNNFCQIIFAPPIMPGIYLLAVKIPKPQSIALIGIYVVIMYCKTCAFFPHKNANLIFGYLISADLCNTPE